MSNVRFPILTLWFFFHKKYIYNKNFQKSWLSEKPRCKTTLIWSWLEQTIENPCVNGSNPILQSGRRIQRVQRVDEGPTLSMHLIIRTIFKQYKFTFNCWIIIIVIKNYSSIIYIWITQKSRVQSNLISPNSGNFIIIIFSPKGNKFVPLVSLQIYFKRGQK